MFIASKSVLSTLLIWPREKGKFVCILKFCCQVSCCHLHFCNTIFNSKGVENFSHHIQLCFNAMEKLVGIWLTKKSFKDSLPPKVWLTTLSGGAKSEK